MSSNSSETAITNDDGDEYIYMASTTQQLIVSSLQLPSSILSLIGSSLIIVNVRSIRKKTPYRRILLALSTCDIISTIGFFFQPFLADKNVPDAWVWSIGNHASCVMLGSLSQFGTPSSHLYSLSLATYFLLTVRFGMKERAFEKKYERWIHALIMFFSISTAIAGVLLGIFRPSILSPGCWISAPAEGCSEDCPEAKWAWFFGGLPSILTLVGICISNTMLYLHVRRTVMEGEKRALANERKLESFQAESSAMNAESTTVHSENNTTTTTTTSGENVEMTDPANDASSSLLSTATSTKPNKNSNQSRSILRSSDKQWKRVQEVGKQAFLYVGAYFLSFSWTFCINYLDSIDYEYKPGSERILFPLLILQAIFTPIFGLFTCIIFFRPKLQAARIKFPDEPWWWVVQQVVTGNAADGRTTRIRRPSSSRTSNTTNNSRRSSSKRRSWVTRINFAGERLSGSNSGTAGSFQQWSSRGLAVSKSSSMRSSLRVIDESQEEQASKQKTASHNNNEQASNDNDLTLMGDNEVRAIQHNYLEEVNDGDEKKQQTSNSRE